MDSTIQINTGNGTSEDFRIRQGCPLSPVLLNLYLDEVTRTWLMSKCFNELICNTLLFADDQFIISDTEDNFQKAVYLLYNKSKQNNLEIATNKTKVFGSVGTDHFKNRNYYKYEILEQVNQFTYLDCIISYQCSNDVEFNLAKFLQLIGNIKRAIFK